MGNNKHKQTGAGAAGLLAVVAIIAVIGLIGWMVVRNKQSSGDANATDSSVAAADNEPMPTYAATDNYVNVVQDDKSVKTVTPAGAAGNGSQARILQSLHETCAGKPDTAVTITAKTFGNQETYRLQDGYAYINASVCDPIGNGVAAISLTNRSAYLHRDKQTGNWLTDDVTQAGASCEKLDGKGYPFEIAQTCQAADGSMRALQK